MAMIGSRKAAVGAFASGATVLMLGSAAFACTSIQGRMTVTGGGGQSEAVGGPGSHAYCSVTGGAQGSSKGSVTIAVSTYTNTGPGDDCPTTRLEPSADAPGGPGWVRNPDCFAPDGTTPLPTCSSTFGGTYYRWEGQGWGDYEVRFQSGGTFTRSGSSYTHDFGGNSACIDGDPADFVVLPGGLTVAADGTGTWTGTLPKGLAASGPTDAGALCIVNTRDPATPPQNPDIWTAVYGVDGMYNDQPAPQTNQAPIVII